jgi:hypothetical protein
MKRLAIRTAVLALAMVGASGVAHAARVGVGIYVAPAPYYYPVAPVPYYYPPAVAIPVEPSYIEQAPAAAPADPAQSAGSWYYCDASRTYYPYVKSCSSGWRQVPAQPPAN